MRKPFNNEELQTAKDLIEMGLGRRVIAEALGLSDWRARMLLEEAKQSLNTSRPPAKVQVPRSKGESTYGKPEIKKSSSTLCETYKEAEEGENVSVVVSDNDYKVAVLSDLHYPFEDKKAIALVKAYLKDNPVDEVIFLGDVVDFYSVSSYLKDNRKASLQEEIAYAVKRLQEWVEEFPSVEFRFLEGNHETRLARLISKQAPELAGLGRLKVDSLLELEDLGIDFIPTSQDLEIGDMTFTHGTFSRKNAGSSVIGEFDKTGSSTIQGHCHRLALTYKRNKQGFFALVENGTLAKMNVEYVRMPNWCQGFTVINYKGQQASPFLVPIINGRIIANSKTYEVK